MDEWLRVAGAWMVREWEHSESPDSEELAKLRGSVVAYMERINQTANDELISRSGSPDCSCGCDSCE